MAIDLFCYLSTTTGHAQEMLDMLTGECVELFSEKFLISPVREANAFHKEIAFEYGLNANCIFLVRVNDKNEVGLLPKVEALIKTTFGNGKVIILLENETLR